MGRLWLIAAVLCAVIAGHASSDLGENLRRSLLPMPHRLEVTGAAQTLPKGPWVLHVASPVGAMDPANPLKTEARIGERKSEAGSSCYLMLTTPGAAVPPGDLLTKKLMAREDYELRMFPQTGVIAMVLAGGDRGLMYGAQTLAQLLAREKLSALTIEDWPDMSVRELHVHGFDKGYGAGDLKSVTAYTQDLPAFLPAAARGRFNLFRLSIDAGWINNADAWTHADVDRVMRQVISDAHRNGIDLLVEVRLQTQRTGSSEIDLLPLDPLKDWATYEKALQRALSWGPDAIDLSLNDLGALNSPEIRAKYGGDGRFSGKLMAEMLHKAQVIIDEVKPGTALYHLPRFYGLVHWKQHPRALPELWANAPKGVVMYSTTDLLDEHLVQMRKQYGAHFQLWINYTSNHAKELRTLLTGPIKNDLVAMRDGLAATDRRVLVNLGYPMLPQQPVAMATGEWLWNVPAFDPIASLDRAAHQLWAKDWADGYVQYAKLLDWETSYASLGQHAAGLMLAHKVEEDAAVDPAAPPMSKDPAKWREYVDHATQAMVIAEQMKQTATNAQDQRLAEILYYNAMRVKLDSQAGVEIATALKEKKPVDRDAIEKLLKQHEAILGQDYPVEPNDPKSAEVVRRGIKRIRQVISK